MNLSSVSPEAKATSMRIDRALAQPGAKGKRGFLLWVAAAYPKKVADAVALAASKHIPSGGFGGFGYGPRLQWKTPAMFQGFGDDAGLVTVGVDSVDLTPSTSQAVADATDSAPPSSSWLSDITNAFAAVSPTLAQAYATKQQLSNAQTIFNMNLQRAATNKPLLNYDPSKYGSLTPTVNFGLAGGTQSTLLLVAGGLAGVYILSQLMKKAH